MPILVLFGAGASHGSEPGRHPTPPLGGGLFAKLEGIGGVAARAPEDIKSMFLKDFEVGMAAYNFRCELDRESFHREMSLYLAGFTPSSENRYVSLLNVLSSENVIYASLNYDMMFELSARHLGMGAAYNSLRNPGNVRILKPHGSVNFWHSLNGSFENVVATACGSSLDAPVAPVTWEKCISLNRDQTSFSPAIAMYAKGKKVMVCPQFVSQQQRYFANACKSASKIIIIGVKVVTEDLHIWNPIAKSRAEITYFGSEEDEVDFVDWVALTKRKKSIFVNGYFDSAISYLADKFEGSTQTNSVSSLLL